MPTPPRLFAIAVAGQFIFGIVLALPGTLFGMRSWTDALAVDVGAQANLLALFFTGQLVCTAVAGVAVDHAGAQRVLASGSALLVVGFVMLARAAGVSGALLALAVLAAGGSSINAATNTLVSVTFGTRRGAMLSMMGVAGGVGALTAPIALAGVPDAHGVAMRLLSLAVAAACTAILPLALAPAPHASAGVSFRAMGALASDRALAGLITLLAIEFGLEAVLAGWSAAYALAVLPPGRASMIVAAYWGGLCLGRSATPAVLARASKLTTITAAAAVVAAAVGSMALAPSAAWLMASALAAGIAVGPLAPTLIAVAGDRYPRRTGLVIGVLLSVAQIGGIVMPWTVGRAAILAGFRVALMVPVAGAVLLAAGATLARVRRAAPRLPQSEPA